MREIFAAHFARYPAMTPQDAVKLAYQSAYGPGHLLTDPAAFSARLEAELAAAPLVPGQPLLEEIGNGYQRFSLSAKECKGLSVDTISFLFSLGAKARPEDHRLLTEYLDVLRTLTAVGLAPFSPEELELFLRKYLENGCPAVSHSEAYRAAYAPAYRVMDGGLMAFLPLFRAIDTLLTQKNAVTVAIDGMAAAGKSTLGAMLARRYGCPLLHMDDFFLPPSLRTAQRLAVPGGNVHHERFREEVLPGLVEDRPFSYGVFDCHTMSIIRRERVKSNRLTVVEGAYALHPDLRDVYDFKVFYSVDPQEQLERIRLRNGPGCVPAFRDKWIPLEQAYFAACGVQACCDMIL